MKHLFLKRIGSLFLAGLLACALCACQDTSGTGSTGEKDKDAQSTGSESAVEALAQSHDAGNGLTVPIAQGDVTITIMCNDGAPSAFGKSLNKDSFPVLEQIEKNLGVNIQYEAFASDAYGPALDSRIAAGGKELPDVFVQGGADVMKLAKNGIVADLSEYINEETTPNLVKFFEQHPEVLGTLTTPDGAIYALPNRVSFRDAEYSCLTLGYRKDWADKLNISTPETIEDWYRMLTAFKNDDPNGNGEQDEIPVICWSENQIFDFAAAYGLSPQSSWFSVIDGKVTYDFTSAQNKEKTKAYVEEMRKWFAEGLIDQDLGVEHHEQAQAKLLSDKVGVEQNWNSYFPSYNQQMQPLYPDVNWAVAPPPEGPFGDKAYEVYPALNNERWIITSNNENIELTMKLYDYLFASEEGSMLVNCGIEGEDYRIENGEVVFSDSILNHEGFDNAAYALINRTGGGFPTLINDAYAENIMSGGMPEADKQVLKEASSTFKTMFPNLILLPEESEIIAGKLSDIETYQKEMLYKFIMGRESMDQYDAFVAKLETLGVNEIVGVRQAQYDRYQAAMKEG